MKATELEQLLHHSIPANKTVLITGHPGLGKSQIVESVVSELIHHKDKKPYDLMKLYPACAEPTDFYGQPWVIDNKAVHLPYEALDQMVHAKRPLVVFIDDIGQAMEATQKPLMQLLWARETANGTKISEHVRFVAATNKRDDMSGVSHILEAVKSRFHAIVELTFDLDSWKKWAFKNDIHPIIIAFADFRTSLLSNWKPTREIKNSPSPRTFSMLSDWVKLELPQTIRYETYYGAIGDATPEFIEFERLADDLEDPKVIFNNPKKAKLPDKTKPDLCCATASMIAYHVTKETVPAFAEYISRFTDQGLLEYAVLAAQGLVMKDRQLVYDKSLVDWIRKCSPHLENWN